MPKVRARRGGKPKTSKITLAPTSFINSNNRITEITMSVNIRSTLQTAANKVQVAEEAATLIADWLIDNGYEMSKPTKNVPDQAAIEAAEAAQKRQTGSADTTPADAVVAGQLRVQPAVEPDSLKK